MLYEAKEGIDKGIMTILGRWASSTEDFDVGATVATNQLDVLDTVIHFAIYPEGKCRGKSFIPHLSQLMAQGCDFSFQPSNGLRSNHAGWNQDFSPTTHIRSHSLLFTFVHFFSLLLTL